MSTTTNQLADQALQTAESAIRSTQRVVGDTEQLARRGINAVRDGSEVLRDKAMRTTDSTIAYIKDEPLKSVLIAAATGAALVLLASMLTRSRGQRD